MTRNYMLHLASSHFRTALCGLFLLLLCAGYTWNFSIEASHKRFWLDEANEVRDQCPESFWAMFKDGVTEQCSPAPLYYAAFKLSYYLVDGFDSKIMLTYRLVSLVSAFAFLLLLGATFWRNFGWTAAIFAILIVVEYPLFRHYAAENRPYMLWTALMMASYLCIQALIEQRSGMEAKRDWLPYVTAVILILLTMVIGPGLIQAVGFLLLILALGWLASSQRISDYLRNHIFYVVLLILLAAIGLYYQAHSPCGYNPRRDTLGLLLSDRNQIRKFFIFLFKSRPLMILSLIGLGAAAYGIVKLLKEKKLTGPWLLGGLMLGQLTIGVLVAAIVVIKNYHFVSRLFLHLLPLRPFFLIFALWLVYSWFVRRFPMVETWMGKIRPAATGIVVAYACYYFFNSYAAAVNIPAQNLSAQNENCVPLPVPVSLWVKEEFFSEYSPNFIIDIDAYAKRCGVSREPATPTFALAESMTGGIFQFRVSGKPEAGFKELTQCGQPVIYEGKLGVHDE